MYIQRFEWISWIDIRKYLETSDKVRKLEIRITIRIKMYTVYFYFLLLKVLEINSFLRFNGFLKLCEYKNRWELNQDDSGETPSYIVQLNDSRYDELSCYFVKCSTRLFTCSFALQWFFFLFENSIEIDTLCFECLGDFKRNFSQ